MTDPAPTLEERFEEYITSVPLGEQVRDEMRQRYATCSTLTYMLSQDERHPLFRIATRWMKQNP